MPGPPQARHRAAASPTAHPETFLCTFCWRPRHAGDATPSMVVGRGARLACGPCYGALLDLAVCWVCGEVVFRGDECVSLGWCFWHRSCYGCLVCGDPRVARGVTVGELFADGDDGGDGADGSKGREVDEVPLCGKCAGEVARDRAGDEQLVPMALGRIDRFDGGLSRRRWEAGMGRPPQRQAAAVEGEDARGARAGHRSAEEAAGTRGGRAQGAATGPRDHHHQRFETSTTTSACPPDRAEQPDRCRAASPVYVSMHDPVGEPSFRPSRTKPIPKWMQQLPSQRQCARDRIDRPSSIVDDYFSPPEPSSTDTDSDMEAGTRGPTPTQTPPPPPPPPPPPVPPHTVPVRAAAPATRVIHPTPPTGPDPSSTRGNSASGRDVPDPASSTTAPQARDSTFSPFQMSRPFTLIAEEPAQRPSSKLGAGRLPPSRHVRFISPPQASSPSSASSSAASGQRHGSGRPSGSSDFVERYAGHHGHDVDGDGMVEPVDRAEGPGPVMSFQEQLMRVFGF
ncbi:hypothetical protein VSDG_08537 [Cytospora chrysosperma]|uniref:LIM zinc-binding domain-containing protein n=1 Tax=Cytospora chrysosperma TaxID=252740 RepID=A0A423VEW0_CYTCH|nr:hypothetical protein VSDG_08537 [Valsa sordida]